MSTQPMALNGDGQPPTAATIEDAIIVALHDSNIPAVGALLTQLAAVDPRRTRTLIDAMQTGIDAARK